MLFVPSGIMCQNGRVKPGMARALGSTNSMRKGGRTRFPRELHLLIVPGLRVLEAQATPRVRPIDRGFIVACFNDGPEAAKRE